MKTLYVSDLDGTLFNNEKKITKKSADIINDCMEKGLNFTIATARMPYGCDYRLSALHLSLPAIVANGVFLYDFKLKKYEADHVIDNKSAAAVLEVFHRFNTSCFVYSLTREQLNIYYEKEEQRAQTQYYSERALGACREVCMSKDIMQRTDGQHIVYMAYTGTLEEVEPIARELQNIKGIAVAKYLNVYNGWYCIEIFHESVSKKSALLKLKKILNFDELVVFGDNYNDSPMFDIADRKYAPENAVVEIKERADAMIPHCDRDGVALFLKKEVERLKG